MVNAAMKVNEATLECAVLLQMELPAGGFADLAPPRTLARTVSIPVYAGENLFCSCLTNEVRYPACNINRLH